MLVSIFKKEEYKITEGLDDTELLQSFCEDQVREDNTSDEMKKDLCEKYLSDIEFYIRNVLKDNKLTVLLERGKASELQDDNTRLEKKLKLMAEKVSLLERELEGSFNELETTELKSEKDSKHTEFKKSIKIQKEIAVKEEMISNLQDENSVLKKNIDELELEKVENEIEREQLETMLREHTEELENTENVKTDKQDEVKTENDFKDPSDKTIDSNKALIDFKNQLEAIVLIQEKDIKAKNLELERKTREVELMSRKIRQWGLDDKLTDEPKVFTPKRKAFTSMSTPSSKTNTKSNRQSKIKIENIEGFEEEADTSLNDSMEIDDNDPNHPTSSFSLRKKGRKQKGRKKLQPIGSLEEYERALVPDIIVNKGEDYLGGVERYFVIRNPKYANF